MQVIKIGGNELENAEFRTALAIVLQRISAGGRDGSRTNRQTVLVHGGGRGTTGLMERLGLPVRFERGLRVTDEAALQAVVMATVGVASTELVASLTAQGVPALGLSGADAGFVTVEPGDPALGLVGHPTGVAADRLQALCDAGFVPCIAPVCPDKAGRLYNVNADEVATAVATALKATRLVYLTNVPGVLDQGRLVPTLDARKAADLFASGAISGGMQPKLQAALAAVTQGVPDVLITNLEGLQTGQGTHVVALERISI